MRLKITPVALASACLLSVMACSSSDDKSGPGAVSSVDSSKALSGLSDADAKQLCKDAQSYTEKQMASVDSKKYSCGMTGLMAAGMAGAETDEELQSKCKEAASECMSKPAEKDPGTDGQQEDPCADPKKELANCDATVGEYNQCMSDSMDAWKAYANKDVCAEAKIGGSSGDESAGLAEPESCKALNAKCPGLGGGTQDDAPATGSDTDG